MVGAPGARTFWLVIIGLVRRRVRRIDIEQFIISLIPKTCICIVTRQREDFRSLYFKYGILLYRNIPLSVMVFRSEVTGEVELWPNLSMPALTAFHLLLFFIWAPTIIESKSSISLVTEV